MNVLSLFDGISCGQIALEIVGIKVNKYYASEIDKSAIAVTQDNYPNTIQLGDVIKVKAELIQNIDLLIGGSPCQGFSFIGKGLNFDDDSSKLFFEFARLLKETSPVYFLLENVKMKREYSQIITEYLKVEPMVINSNLVSAQNRERIYWTNIHVNGLPDNKYILLDDIIDNNCNEFRIPKNWKLRVPSSLPKYVDPYNKVGITNKSTTLRTNVNNGNMWIKVKDGYRNLTRNEAEILQNLPINYTKVISDNKAKKCIGNGWTIDIIVHLFNGIDGGDVTR